MRKLKGIFGVLCAAIFLGLEGCVAAPFLIGAGAATPNIGEMVDRASTDSDISFVELVATTTADAFVENTKATAVRLGYRVEKVDGQGPLVRGVLVAKQSTNIGEAFIGRDWKYQIAVNLDADGKTVKFQATTEGNNHKADPGTAKAIIEEFRRGLQERYASK
ncbi:TPA: hypothetical protein DIV48_03800 [Candidatus Kaiserbacteria bacterium]|nr:MAG: hypothetical protein UY93_C0004G0038 [Parcubacteria group bacterium GW2011_GWA1_56_13]KKW47035.1 MAG: hypothetical protein UY97_C0001G0092 [Parcubacteria group bacterium GW2011_GWB1_57_6]HCR52736.1 hypothetical protein [Candidatus Kaiserbacteria bacterium]